MVPKFAPPLTRRADLRPAGAAASGDVRTRAAAAVVRGSPSAGRRGIAALVAAAPTAGVRGVYRGEDRVDADARRSRDEVRPVAAVAIANQVAGLLTPGRR